MRARSGLAFGMLACECDVLQAYETAAEHRVVSEGSTDVLSDISQIPGPSEHLG
jgi:hypothetical protein